MIMININSSIASQYKLYFKLNKNFIFNIDYKIFRFLNSPLVPLRSICENRRTTSISCTGVTRKS